MANNSLETAEELLNDFMEIKKLFIQEVKQKELIESKLVTNRRYVNLLEEQISIEKKCIERQQKSLNELKEKNSSMDSVIDQLNKSLTLKENEIQYLKQTIASKDITEANNKFNENEEQNKEQIDDQNEDRNENQIQDRMNRNFTIIKNFE